MDDDIEGIVRGDTELEAYGSTQHYNLVRDIERGCAYFWAKRGGDPADRWRWNHRGDWDRPRLKQSQKREPA